MGMAHLLYIYDDGIRDAADDADAHEQIASQVGTGVLKLCLDPDYRSLPSGEIVRVTRASTEGHGNAINHCDRVHAGGEEVYMWSGNRLASIGDLDDDELERLSEIVSEERRRRADS
jgi:hypothetical protein